MGPVTFVGENTATAEEILRSGVDYAGGTLALACSFSTEDIIIIDLIARHGLPVGVFAIDTGRLNEETYEVAEAVRERYGNIVHWHFPDRAEVEALERDKGLYSFRKSLADRHECCRIRKVEPLERALKGLSGWVTGLRTEQSVTRTALEAISFDDAHDGILKVNPLLAWKGEDVERYAMEYSLPMNRLLSQNYLSVGCEPCTRAVKPGEHARAGRWWWESPEEKECGLHVR